MLSMAVGSLAERLSAVQLQLGGGSSRCILVVALECVYPGTICAFPKGTIQA